jgi:serine/threonine protein kinase/tetratricopeptide (TPR) repeat protein
MVDRVGQQFGNYRLVVLLGQGGFAEVYLGQHVRLELQAAIKVLHTHLTSQQAEHFQGEAQTITKLTHPSIVRVFDYDVQDGVPFLVMDYAPNGSLRHRYPMGSVVPLDQIVSSVKQVAAALQYAHERKVIHRDVKPENMLVGRQQEVLLSDFGLATLAHSSASLTTQEVIGTLPYMAPEQIEGHPHAASDQYALGIVVYEWLCGSRPFKGLVTEVMVQHLSTPPPPLRERVSTVPPEVEQVVLRALAKEPKARFASVAAFAEALERASQLTPAPAPNTQSLKILHNLPPQYGVFLGREKDIARVLEGLSSRWPLISIEGLAGIGKTTLAIEAAHRCLPGPNATLDEPFDIVVWVSASGRPEQKRWMNEVFDSVARMLGYPYVMQVAPENKPIEVDHLLRNHRTLVIVDNFETIIDPDLLNWIQSVPEPSKALITTRHHHLRRVWDIHLKGLDDKEALELIRRNALRLGLQSVQTASEELLLPLVRVTEGTPWIIEMALGYVKGGRLSLQQVVDHLYKGTKTVESIFDYLFAHNWKLMTRDAQHVLMVVPFFADSMSAEALGATTNLSDYRLDVAIEQLVELALLDINEEFAVSNQRYSTHPLTRAFASSKLNEEQAFEMEARMRWSKYYVAYVARNILREKPTDTYWNVLKKDVYAELDLEYPNLQNVLAWSAKQKKDVALLELVLMLAHYMGRRLLYPERISYAQLAAEAANRLNRKKDEAWLRIDALGWVYTEEGKFTDALREISTGLHIAQNMLMGSTDAIDVTALGHAFLARAFLEQGDIAEAAATIEKALDLECTPLIRCRVNMVAGDIAVREENYIEAIQLYETATRITQEEEDIDFDTILRYRLGSAYFANRELTAAESEFKKVHSSEQQGVNIMVMYTKYGLARVAWARGDKEQARRLAQEILEVLSPFTNSHQLLSLINPFLSYSEEQE